MRITETPSPDYFNDYEQNIGTAEMLLYESSGLDITYDANNVHNTRSYARLHEYIKQHVISVKVKADCMKNYHMGFEGNPVLTTCGVCGERTLGELVYQTHKLSSNEFSFCRLDEKEIDAYEAFGEYRGLCNVVIVPGEDEDLLYYLHACSVTEHKGVPYVDVCKPCWSKLHALTTKVDLKDGFKDLLPTYSVARGHDYANLRGIIGLEVPTLMEMNLIALTTMYAAVVKVNTSEATSTGHTMFFENEYLVEVAQVAMYARSGFLLCKQASSYRSRSSIYILLIFVDARITYTLSTCPLNTVHGHSLVSPLLAVLVQ